MVQAFTVVELLVVMAVVAILLALLVPVLSDPPRRSNPIMQCINNLHQTGLGFWMWSSDHQGQFPWQTSASRGGTSEFVADGPAFIHFQTLSNYRIAPRIYVCPTDPVKHAAASLADFSDANLSYFVDLDAGTNQPSISVLTGDRHLQTNGTPVKAGLVTLARGVKMTWSRELHGQVRNGPFGNILFADGHCEGVKKNLSTAFERPGLKTNRLAVP